MKRPNSSIDTAQQTFSPLRQSCSTVKNTAESWKEAKVTKKVHSCTECQSRKVKCTWPPGNSVCDRCGKKDLTCVVNKTLQTLLEEETGWRKHMLEDSQTLQAAMADVLRALQLPPLQSYSAQSAVGNHGQQSPSETAPADNATVDRNIATVANGTSDEVRGSTRQQQRVVRMGMTRENSLEPDIPQQAIDTIVTEPMSSLYEVTRIRSLRGGDSLRSSQPEELVTNGNDLISRGKISETEAQELFNIFNTTLNHFLWGGIALVHQDLASVRRSSPLLLAAILSVTALHMPEKTDVFDICYNELCWLVSDGMFDRHHILDSIRGLCIGAFWLPSVSWKFSGHAVRMATELNLHRSYSQAIKGHHQHVEGARLWYLLYVCDHHFSIAYGRPPVIHEDVAILRYESFLRLPGITEADIRLQSQVSLFIILTRIYNAFGSEIDQVLDEHELDRINHFSGEIDAWLTQWETRLAPSPYVMSYPAKGVVLHHRFAKFQLNSLALRGLNQIPHEFSTQRKQQAHAAISCALAVLNLIIKEPSITKSLNGVPLYLHTMITYAAVFLLKIIQNWRYPLPEVDNIRTFEVISQVIHLLRTMPVSERHLSHHIAKGLKRMLDRVAATSTGTTAAAVPRLQNGQHNYADSAAVHALGNGTTGTFGALNGTTQQDMYADRHQVRFVPLSAASYDWPPQEMYDENYFPIGFFDLTM